VAQHVRVFVKRASEKNLQANKVFRQKDNPANPGTDRTGDFICQGVFVRA
jgi:hypothetical protein